MSEIRPSTVWRAERARETRGLHLAAAAAFVVTAFLRFAALPGLSNDHFLYLAPAQQMLLGELPSRDFVDPGTPLMYVASAVAQLVAGPPLLAEALLVSVMFGLAAGLTVYAAFRASGLLAVAVLATAVEVAMFPRPYHYPKLLLYAAAVLAMWRYVAAPSMRRAAALAGCVVVAFLFRHDHGAYLGAAGLIAVAGARPGWRDAARRTAQYIACVALFVSPYLFYLGATTGVRAHVASGLAYSRAEAQRTTLPMPRFDLDRIRSPDNARVWLFYTFHLMPLVALAVVSRRMVRDRSEAARAEAAQVLPLAILAMAANVALLRDPLQARLPDVAVPACVLASWLVPQVWRSAGSGRLPARALVIMVLVVSLAGVNVVGAPREQLNRAGLFLHPDRWVMHLGEQIAALRAPFHPGQIPSVTLRGLVPFIEYVDRCTDPGHRLFVAGEAPEIYVYARRPFAGGQPALRNGYFSTMKDQRRLVLRLRQQQVPLALILTDSDAESFPLVMQELHMEFLPLTEIRANEHQTVLVRVKRGMDAHAVDAATGLPCFR